MANQNRNKWSVLVVEDELILGNLCVRLLGLNGYAVKLVSNGLIAKEMVSKQHFDLCLSDIKTPVMNGIEFFKYLKEALPALAEKTIFMTGDVMNKETLTFLKESKVPYITKPFDNAQLIQTIGDLVQKPGS
jgi:CheY-like chemotaxis protein